MEIMRRKQPRCQPRQDRSTTTHKISHAMSAQSARMLDLVKLYVHAKSCSTIGNCNQLIQCNQMKECMKHSHQCTKLPCAKCKDMNALCLVVESVLSQKMLPIPELLVPTGQTRQESQSPISPKPSKVRGSYKCKKCHQAKAANKGPDGRHVCIRGALGVSMNCSNRLRAQCEPYSSIRNRYGVRDSPQDRASASAAVANITVCDYRNHQAGSDRSRSRAWSDLCAGSGSSSDTSCGHDSTSSGSAGSCSSPPISRSAMMHTAQPFSEALHFEDSLFSQSSPFFWAIDPDQEQAEYGDTQDEEDDTPHFHDIHYERHHKQQQQQQQLHTTRARLDGELNESAGCEAFRCTPCHLPCSPAALLCAGLVAPTPRPSPSPFIALRAEPLH